MSHPGLPQLTIILLYLAALLALGVFSSRWFRGTKADYQVASHSIGPILLLMSMFGTTMTAFALVGSTAESFREGIGVYGMLASSSGIVHSLCFFVIGVKVWSLARIHGYSTQIGFFRDRLDSDFVGLLLFPLLVGLVIPYLLIGVIGGGGVIQALTAGLAPEWFPVELPDGTPDPVHGGIPPWLGSLVICLVVLIYVFFGGMRGTTWANTFQTLVFMVLGVVTFYVIAHKLGKQDGLLENLKVLGESIPYEKKTRVGMSQAKFFTYLLIPLSVGMFPHVFQHWMTARSTGSFKLAVVFHPIFILIVWAPCVLVGAWAAGALMPADPPLPMTPGGAVDANKILPFLVKTQTGPILGGFLAAGILAAIMSSLDSQFLCIGTIFNNDVVTHYLGKGRLSDRQQVLLTRVFIVGIVAVTYLLSLGNVRSVFALGVWCFSGFSALVPLVVAALYWRRLTAAGAIAGILAVILSWCVLFYRALQVPISEGGLGEYMVELPIAGTTYAVMPVVAMVLAELVAMIAVSLVTRPPGEETLARYF